MQESRETCPVTMGTDAPIYPAAGPCEGATAAVQPPGLVRGCGAVPHPSRCPSGLLSGWWPPSCVWVLRGPLLRVRPLGCPCTPNLSLTPWAQGLIGVGGGCPASQTRHLLLAWKDSAGGLMALGRA